MPEGMMRFRVDRRAAGASPAVVGFPGRGLTRLRATVYDWAYRTQYWGEDRLLGRIKSLHLLVISPVIRSYSLGELYADRRDVLATRSDTCPSASPTDAFGSGDGLSHDRRTPARRFIELTANIVSAYLSNNPTPGGGDSEL